MRRHAALVATGIFVVATVAAVIAFYTVRLSGERDKARREADRARAASSALASVFTSADPSVAQGEATTTPQPSGPRS